MKPIRPKIRGWILRFVNSHQLPRWLRRFLISGLPFGLRIMGSPNEKEMAQIERYYQQHPEELRLLEMRAAKFRHDVKSGHNG